MKSSLEHKETFPLKTYLMFRSTRKGPITISKYDYTFMDSSDSGPNAIYLFRLSNIILSSLNKFSRQPLIHFKFRLLEKRESAPKTVCTFESF